MFKRKISENILMKLKRLFHFTFFFSLLSLSVFAQEPKNSEPEITKSEDQKTIAVESTDRKLRPSNLPEKFKDDFLKMNVQILPPIMKLRDDEIQWNQNLMNW
jgi:hypothetical protein